MQVNKISSPTMFSQLVAQAGLTGSRYNFYSRNNLNLTKHIIN